MKLMKFIATFVFIVFFINLAMPMTLAIDSNEKDMGFYNNIQNQGKNKINENKNNQKEENKENENTESQRQKEVYTVEQKNKSVENNTNTNNKQENKESQQAENKVDNINQNESEQITNLSIQGEQAIPDGVYRIKASVGTNMYLDIDAGSKLDCANLQIWQKSNVKQQKFKVEYNKEGHYYTITAMHSGKVLDVCSAEKNNGANVWQYKNNETEAQQWVIKDVGNGKKSIISRCNNLYLDVFGGYKSNGTNVQMYKSNGTAAQQFVFEETEVKEWKAEQTIKDGLYRIRTNIDSNMCLDIDAGSKKPNANLQIWSSNNVAQQKFQVTYLNNGYYKIAVLHSGKVLDVNNAGTENGTNVKQYNDTGSKAQQWIIQETETKGVFNIVSKCNGLCLDVNGANKNNGTNVQMYEYNGSAAQQFIFEEIKDIDATYSIVEGEYKIASALNENKVLDVDAGSYVDGTNVHIWQSQNVKQQIFLVKYIGEGLYTIEILYSGKVLDVANAGTGNGTNIWQYTSNNSNAQKWIIKESEKKGYYYIISKCNGIYLDVADGKANDGANIQMHEKFQDDNTRQLFKFIPYSESTKPIIYDGTYRITSALEDIDCKAFDISEGSKAAKANLQLWSSTNVLQQKFKLVHLEGNCYNIEVVHSHMNLEVENSGMEPRTNVWQNNKNDSDAQKWIIEDAGNGYYYIKSKLNGLYLDVCDGKAKNGANIWLYTKNETNAQKFKFEEIYFGIDVSVHNGDINYDALVNSGRADFMITRIGYTTETQPLVVDNKYERNYREAKARRIPLGGYVYTYADTIQEVQTQTIALVNYLKQNNYNFELPIFFDIEDENQRPLSTQMRTDMCNTFCNIMRDYGYKSGIYSSKNWIMNKDGLGIYIDQIPSDVSIWVASYGTYEWLGGNNGNVPKSVFQYFGNHDIWQFSSHGNIDGVSGNVDVDIAYKRMW